MMKIRGELPGRPRADLPGFAIQQATRARDTKALASVPLPSDAIVVEVREEPVWSDESIEYNALRTDPRTPKALRSHLQSFKESNGTLYHAFDGKGTTLSAFDWYILEERGIAFSDSVRLGLITGLLDAVDYMHSRGSAHLGLDATSIRIAPLPDSLELRVVGLGAGVSLGRSTDRSYFMGNSIYFHPPETLSSTLIKSTLPALFKFDSWAVGVLLAMLAGSMNQSPFQADEDWSKGIFTPEQGVRKKLLDAENRMGKWLMQVNEGSSGFLFRHGWVVELLIGLLQTDPEERLDIGEAYSIAQNATAIAKSQSKKPYKSASLKEKRDLMTAATATAYGTENEPYRSLEAVLNIVDRGAAYMVVEKRPGLKNYGEIVGFKNRISGKRWDVFLPGVKDQMPDGEVMKVRRVLGVVMCKGGNHKLAVELYKRNATTIYNRITDDVQLFLNSYVAANDDQSLSRLKYMKLEHDPPRRTERTRDGRKKVSQVKNPMEMFPATAYLDIEMGGSDGRREREKTKTELFQAAPDQVSPFVMGIGAGVMISALMGIGVGFAMRRSRYGGLSMSEEALLPQ